MIINSSNKSIEWMSIPYFPVNIKHLMLMVVVFFVGASGTSLSRFEAFAVSFIAYSTALILDRVENVIKFIITLSTLGTAKEE